MKEEMEARLKQASEEKQLLFEAALQRREDVMADNFEYGSDKHAILMLPNEVDMVARKSFKRPTRESIMAPGARLSGMGPSTPRRSAGGRQSRSSHRLWV